MMPSRPAWWLGALLVLGAPACNAIFGVDGLAYDSPGSTASNGGGGTSAGTSTSSDGGGGSGGQAGGGGLGGEAGGGGEAGNGSTPLVGDDDALVRYFMDDAESGIGDGMVRDALPNPVHLSLQDVADTAYVVEPTGRGLFFGPNANGTRAITSLAGTKLTGLIGVTSWTIEIVVTVLGAQNTLPRFLHIGPEGQPSAELAMRMEQATGFLSLDVNDATGQSTDHSGLYALNLLESSRLVLHAVMDTTEALGNDRLRAYANGQRIMSTTIGQFPVEPPLDANEPLSLSVTSVLVLGNRGTANRPFNGILGYAAIYAGALTQGEIDHNAERLMTNDDP